MRLLFEGGYYSECGYYSSKYGNLISSIFGGAVVGPGALKPTVGDGIKSRRPLIILSLFFFFSFFHICIYIGVYNNNNKIIIIIIRSYM